MAVPALPVQSPEVSNERAEAVPPITVMACESERGEEAVREVVATFPKRAGVALVEVQ